MQQDPADQSGTGAGAPDSDHLMARRSVLRVLAAAFGGLTFAARRGLAGQSMPTPGAQPGAASAPATRQPLFKISLAEWSLHRTLLTGGLEHLDFPQTAKRDYGIDAVEYVSTFFKSTDAAYIEELEQRAAVAGVRSLLIMVDGEGALGDQDDAARRQAVENHYRWVDAARVLSCHSVRVNALSSGSYDEQLTSAADGLRKLTDFAAARQINVIVENHGGLSSDGGWMAALMRKVDHPRCGTLPDFGNFTLADGTSYDRYRGVAEMMPYARAVSAKSHDFDASGNETETDFRRMLQIVVQAGYHGHLGIEYEGTRLDEPEGIRATKRLLERVRSELS